MVRIADLPDYEAKHLLSKNLGPLGSPAWVPPEKPISKMRFALVTTAGIHPRGDQAFDFTDASFRPIAIDDDANQLIMSHSSVNFERTGFAEDVNLVFPIDRFKELTTQQAIGSLAAVHYSFMGAGLEPHAYEESAEGAADLLKRDRVDAVFLTPV